MRSTVALLLVVTACGAKPGSKQTGLDVPPVPDFHLTDVNPASPRSGQSVSPRDYAGVVTGWYFGHSS